MSNNLIQKLSKTSTQLIKLLVSWPNEDITLLLGIDCGSVGRAGASNIGGPQFESSHRQTFI